MTEREKKEGAGLETEMEGRGTTVWDLDNEDMRERITEGTL